MAYRGREGNISALIATMVLVFIVIGVVVALSVFGIKKPVHKDEFQWITSDEMAEDGMLDGTFYEGEKNAEGILSYKIAEVINVDDTGHGDFKIENSGKNSCLMKVTLRIDGEKIYETGYLKPNQHITADKLDVVPQVGVYSAEATFEGFDPTTEQSIGSTSTKIDLSVIG